MLLLLNWLIGIGWVGGRRGFCGGRSCCRWGNWGDEDGFSVVGEAGDQGSGADYVDFGDAVVFRKRSLRDDLVVEGDGLAAGRDDGVAFEDHAQASWLSGDGGIHGNAEVESEARGWSGLKLEAGFDADIAHEKAVRDFVKVDLRTEEAGEQGGE